MEKKHYIYIGIGLLIIGIITIIVRMYNKPPLLEEEPVKQNKPVVKPVVNDTYPLHKGSTGANVVRLQKALNKNGATLTADGAFGSLTTAELKKQTGKETVTLDELAAIESKGPTVLTSVSTKKEVEDLAVDVKTDIDTTHFTGRSEEYPWKEVSVLSNENLAYLADYYLRVYNVKLFKAVDDATFNAFSNVDTKILNRLRAIKKA